MDQSLSISINSVNKPNIAVLIPHFNNLEGLAETLSSLTYTGSMHIVIVDDGSSEKPKKSKFEAYSQKGEIHFIYKEKNEGVEKALNYGLSYIIGNSDAKYVARIDAGDIQIADRLDKQVSFLEKHEEIGLLGTSANFVTRTGSKKFSVRYPQESSKIKFQMGLRCSILHPTVMFRRSILEEHSNFYPSRYPFADDYAFFYQLLKNTKAANLTEVLTQIEYHEGSTSVKNRKRQLLSRMKIIFDNFTASPLSFIGILYSLVLLSIPYKAVVSFKSKLS